MSKEEKRFIKNATWSIRGLLLAVFCLAAVVFYVGLLANNDAPVNSNNEVKHEETEDQKVSAVPAVGEHHPVYLGGDAAAVAVDLLDQYPELRNGCLFTIVEEQYTPPRELTPLNTLTLPPEACAAIVEFLQVLVAAGEIDVNTLFRVKKLIGV